MNAAILALMTVSVGFSAIAQTLFKHGVMKAHVDTSMNAASQALSLLSSPFVLGGLGLYALGTVCWLFALRALDLSAAYPFVALSFIFVAFSSALFLGETLTPTRLMGTGLIIAGLAVIFLGETRGF